MRRVRTLVLAALVGVVATRPAVAQPGRGARGLLGVRGNQWVPAKVPLTKVLP